MGVAIMNTIFRVRTLFVMLLVAILALTAGVAYAAIQVSKPLPARVVVVPSTMPSIAGDVDANGTVDIVDLALVAANFNTSPPLYPLADVNEDGTVDILDLAQVGINFGKSEGQ